MKYLLTIIISFVALFSSNAQVEVLSGEFKAETVGNNIQLVNVKNPLYVLIDTIQWDSVLHIYFVDGEVYETFEDTLTIPFTNCKVDIWRSDMCYFWGGNRTIIPCSKKFTVNSTQVDVGIKTGAIGNKQFIHQIYGEFDKIEMKIYTVFKNYVPFYSPNGFSQVYTFNNTEYNTFTVPTVYSTNQLYYVQYRIYKDGCEYIKIKLVYL